MELKQHVRIFLSSPSDLSEERQKIKTYIENQIHIDDYIFDVILWENRMPSTVTDDPQRDINKELLYPSDILIGLFKSKFGTKTKNASSGTVEEIEEFIAHSKPVILYFINQTISLNDTSSDDLQELMRIREFQTTYKDKGIYQSLDSFDSIYTHLYTDIQYNLRKLLELQEAASKKAEKNPSTSKIESDGNSTLKTQATKTDDKDYKPIICNSKIYDRNSKWYIQSIAESITSYLKEKGLNYNYQYNLNFHENLLLAQGELSMFTNSYINDTFNNARIFAYNEKYGNFDYSEDLRSKYKDWYKPIRKLIRNHCRSLRNLKIIDIGGNSGEEISEIFGNQIPTSVTLVDISNSALFKAQKKFPEYKCVQENMEDAYCIGEQFDVCLCLRSIQSTGVIRNDSLIQMSRIVKPNGLIIITIPNGYIDEDGGMIRGMFDYRTSDFNRYRPLTLSRKIEEKLLAYGFYDTDIMTLDTEIMIWGSKKDNM